jgi:hypothetical protein
LLNLCQGYGRQGAAHHGLGDLKAAEASYRKGLEVEPGACFNDQIRADLSRFFVASFIQNKM